jgi:hypothetical protein
MQRQPKLHSHTRSQSSPKHLSISVKWKYYIFSSIFHFPFTQQQPHIFPSYHKTVFHKFPSFIWFFFYYNALWRVCVAQTRVHLSVPYIVCMCVCVCGWVEMGKCDDNPCVWVPCRVQTTTSGNAYTHTQNRMEKRIEEFSIEPQSMA